MSRGSARRKSPVPVFAALGDETRLELVTRLSDGERQSISELCEGLELTRQGVTKHLEVLRDAGLVDRKRVGRESLFSIRPMALTGARDYLARVSAQWDRSIARLRSIVEE